MPTLHALQEPLAVGLFVAAYLTIITERLHRTVAALAAGGLAVALGALPQSQAIAAVDWNTLSLLVGMMVLVRVLCRTGLFQAVGQLAVGVAGRRPVMLLLAFALATATISALLDNVTTILVLGPVALAAADIIGVDIMPFALTEIVASNIGGTATLIGDPPNMMIGSAAQLSFGQFVSVLAPVSLLVFAASFAAIALLFRSKLRSTGGERPAPEAFDLDPRLTPRSVAIFGMTVLGLVLHPFGMTTGMIALMGATASLVLLPHKQVEEVLSELDWGMVFFFAGLYVLVGALVRVGVIAYLAQVLVSTTGSSHALLTETILWVSALVSALIDNVPWAAAMIPVIHHLSGVLPQAAVRPLWWALALGTCLGGNGTLIGASANLAMAGIMARRGRPLVFWHYTRVIFPVMLLTIAISATYLQWRFSP